MGYVKRNRNILDKCELALYISYQIPITLLTLSILVPSSEVPTVSRRCILSLSLSN